MSIGAKKSSEKSSSNQTTTNPYAVEAYNGAKSALAGQTYNPLTAGQIQQYSNPFTSEVIGGVQSDYAKTREQTQNSIDDAALSAGAFGGSRHALQAGVADAEGQASLANLIAQLRQSGYSQALGTAQQENASANQFPLLIQQLLTGAAQGTQQNMTGTSKGSGSSLGLSFQYGGK